MPKLLLIQFKCSKCQKVQTHYTWDNDRRKHIHKCECDTHLGVLDIYQPEKVKAPGIRTETKNRV